MEQSLSVDYQEINDGGFVAFGSSRVTDDFSRFSWVLFLATKDETSKVLKPFLNAIENQINKKVKVIRCDNGTEFKNRDLDELCGMKEAVNTACYVLNRTLVTNHHNKTPYELLNGRSPRLDFKRPFGWPVTILNTLDLLGKFKGKADEVFLVGYSVTSKALRVFNTKTKKVKENLHVRFLENKPNVAGTEPNWLFDIDSLTNSMNYIPVFARNQTNKHAGPQDTNGNAAMMHKRFHMSSMGELTFFLRLQVKQSEEGIFISQDKFQVTPKLSHLHVVKRIFRYLKGQPKLGLWYPRDSSFDLEAYSDSDYARANLDRKFTTGEYVVAANYCRQVLWIQNQMLDYGFNIMNTKIYMDNESTILYCKESSVSLKTKHIEIRHHFIRDSYEKKLIQIVDFLSSSTHHALTVSHTIYASNSEQFWSTTNSQIINDEKQIHVTVDGKTVIFENLLLMGYEVVVEGEGLGNPPESQPTPSPAPPIYESQIPESSSSPQNTQSPRQTLEGTGFPHTKGPNFLHLSVDVKAVHKKGGEDMMEHAIELMDIAPQTPHDSPLLGGHTPESDEGSMTLKELMNLYSTLSQNVLDLENVKTAQAKEIAKVIVKDKGSGEKRGSTAETVSTTKRDISTARPEVSTAEPKTPPTTTTLFDDEDVTITDTLVKMKSQKAKEERVAAFKDTKKRNQDQIERDAEVALMIQAYLDEEFRTERERQEEASKAALAGLYDEVQVQIDADHKLPARLTHEEQEKYTVEERKKSAAGSSLKQKSPKKKKVNDQEFIDSDKELKKWLKVVPDDDKAINYETLDVKSLIVDYKDQQAACDEKLVPSDDRVKIGKSNLRMDPSITQREETYQVVLDIINNTLCYNPFLIFVDVPKIYMQQIWLTIKKVKKSFIYQFDIDNKTCINLGEPLELSSTDVYRGRCSAMTDSDHKELEFCREFTTMQMFTKAIIHHFMTKHKSISMRHDSPYYTVDDDEVLDILKFINKGDIYQTNVFPKKITTTSKKKQLKRKVLLHNKSNESEGEPENRPTSKKKRTHRVVFIQEPPSVPVKKTQELSGKLKGIELLSDAAQLEIETLKKDKDQQAACDEKLVPSDDRVKIGKSNLRMDPSITQREETYQVVLDIINNTLCYNPFLISVDVPKIYMQQIWLTIKKVKKSFIYQFDIDNKTCINLGEPLELSSTDVYRGRCSAMTDSDHKELEFCREFTTMQMFTKAIIHHFMTKHKSISMRHDSPYYTVDDDEVLDILKFINKGDIYQTNVFPKKITTTSKKKQLKRKVLLHNKSNESEGEPENRPTSKKKRTHRVVFIQEPPSVPVKKTQELSGKLKGIELLSDAAQLEIETLKVIKASKRKSKFQHQTGGSSEGADIPWKSTIDEESKNDDEEDESDADKSIDIAKFDNERTNTDDEDTIMDPKYHQQSKCILESNLLDALQKVLWSHIKELKNVLYEKRDYIDIIEESDQDNVINKVKNFLPKFLPQAVKEALEKNLPSLGQSSSQGQAAIQAAESLSEYELKKIPYEKTHKSQSNLTHNTHQELYDALTWSTLLDEANIKKGDKHDTILKKRN
nr:hypothetical protein [Tanacetum cinerariifolium]